MDGFHSYIHIISGLGVINIAPPKVSKSVPPTEKSPKTPKNGHFGEE